MKLFFISPTNDFFKPDNLYSLKNLNFTSGYKHRNTIFVGVKLPRMKKTGYILYLVLFALLLFSCQKDEYNPMGVHAEITHVSVFHGHDGKIDLTVTGGVKPINFLWSNNSYNEDIDSLSAGVYTVIISDRLNNSLFESFEILEPEPDSMFISFETTYPTNTGGSDGRIIATVLGGYPPYSYKWSSGQSTDTIENIPAAIYWVTVTDAKNFTATDTVSLIDYIEDDEGNKYGFVVFGNQVWLKENLRVTKDANGNPVESYVYNNDPENENIYGRLYTWDAAMNGSRQEKAQGVCPSGWHIPSDSEYKELEQFLGMSASEANKENDWRGAGIGTLMKQGGSSNFNAPLAGRRFPDGSFSQINNVEYIWTSTEYNDDAAWRRTLDMKSDKVGRWNTAPKNFAYSVRCIKNK